LFERPPGSGIWWIRYHDGDGKERREKVGAKSEARKAYLFRKSEIRVGKFKPESIRPKREASLGHVIKGFLKEEEQRAAAGMLSRNHYEAQVRYGKVWTELLGGKTLPEVEPFHVQNAVMELKARGVNGRRCSACCSEYRAEIDRRLGKGESCRSVARWLEELGHAGNHRSLSLHKQHHLNGRADTGEKRLKADATVNRHLAMLQGLFSWAIDRDLCAVNPVQRFKRTARKKRLLVEDNERARVLKPDELLAILLHLPSKYHLPVLIALGTGLRLSEMLSLRWKDVDFDGGWIMVGENAGRGRKDPGRRTKSKRDRRVPLDKDLPDLFRALPSYGESELVFPAIRKDGPMGRHGGLTQAFRKAIKAAGVEDFSWHDLRHAYASNLAMNGVPLNTIREVLGHSSLRMVLRYAHLCPKHVQEAVLAESVFGGLLSVVRTVTRTVTTKLVTL